MKTPEELHRIYQRRMRRQGRRKFWKTLRNIDPMPWNQAILIGVAFSILIMMCVFGNYVDEFHYRGVDTHKIMERVHE